MAKNSSGVAAIVRQWHLLRTIPRYPRKITVAEVAYQMSKDGYPVSKRTIQRTLNALSSEFPLCVEESRPHGWSWHKDALPFDIPRRLAHDLPVAIAGSTNRHHRNGLTECSEPADDRCGPVECAGPPHRDPGYAAEPCFASFPFPEGRCPPNTLSRTT